MNEDTEIIKIEEEQQSDVEMMLSKIGPKIVMSKPKKKVRVPDLPFEKWCPQFETYREMMEDPEWDEIFSNYYSFENDNEKDVLINETTFEKNDYDHATQIEEIIKCTNSFIYFCIKYAKVDHPIFGTVPFIPYTYQRRVVDCFNNERFNIMSKFRQGGLTTLSVIWATWRCLFKTSQRIMVVSKSDREAVVAGMIADTVLKNLPEWLRPKFSDAKHEKEFHDTSSVLWFYTIKAARGKAITILIIDEAAFIPNMTDEWRAIYPVVSTGGAAIVISTVWGMANWYYNIYKEAEAGKNPFNIIELDYWEHPLYNNPKWIKDTYEVLGEKGWKQEIERNFLGSGDNWINSLIIGSLIDSTRESYPVRQKFHKWKSEGNLRRTDWDEGAALLVWREPIPHHEYIIGVDCAEGVGETGDHSAFQIIDQSTLEQCAEFYSNTIPPHIFAQILNEIGYFYNTAMIAVENAGPGLAVLNCLQHELAYENLYYEDSKQVTPGIKQGKTKRALLLQSLQQRLLNGTMKINSYRFANELNTFVFNANTKKAEAQRGQHDDSILSLSICTYVRDAQTRNMPVGVEMPEEMLQIYRSEVYDDIKKEILEDAPENWLVEEEDTLPLLIDRGGDEEFINIRRKYDWVLKEFSW